jgi:hypothetical protein
MPLLRVICGLIGGLAIGALAWLARPLSRTSRPDRA